MTNKPFSEVIESSLYHWLIQSWDWDTAPAFGSLITIDQGPVSLCGVVYQVQTGSSDPIRYPFPYKKTLDELKAEQPQIFEFLKTTFSCVPIGYFDKGKPCYLLPEQPPLIHSFGTMMSDEKTKDFLYQDGYLHVLFAVANQIPNLDELLLALIKQQAHLGIMTHERIIRFTDTYSLLIGNDYRRLKLFLKRVERII